MSIIFAIPTIFMEHRQEVIKKSVSRLIYQCDLSNLRYKIILIYNGKDTNDFEKWDLSAEKVKKLYSNSQFNISVSLNMVIDEITEEIYFCFIHDDIIILDDDWITEFINIYENKQLNCGVLGLRPHYGSKTRIRKVNRKIQKNLKYKLEEHTWADGCMFMSIEKMNQIGKFDEKYFGDCESEDYNYLLREKGYNNYRVFVEFKHYVVRFGDKLNQKDNSDFHSKVELSRKYRKEKWGKKTKITNNLI